MAAASAAALGSTGGRSSSTASATSGSLTVEPPTDSTSCAARALVQTAVMRAVSMAPIRPPGCWLVGGTGEGDVAEGLAAPELHATTARATAGSNVQLFTSGVCAPGPAPAGLHPNVPRVAGGNLPNCAVPSAKADRRPGPPLVRRPSEP